ncbi:MAG: hypothetical protein LBR56_05495 [Sporomusaceae bacterium]|nr:hypothetical protein [Sporomusaceae bacterium]
MCGLHWYREEIEKADGDNQRLAELKQMMEQRFNISEKSAQEKGVHKEIISLYKDIISRKV